MKTIICITSLVLAFSLHSWASLYGYGTLNPEGGSAIGTIPDNSSIGLTESFTASESGSSISALTFNVVLQGGSATDLSGYLRLGNTSESPSYDLSSLIHGTSEAPGGTTYSVDFGTSGFNSTFNGQNPNDTWTLFFADSVPGDTTTLNGWSLDITAVPEPINAALGLFGVLLVVGTWVTHYIKNISKTQQIAKIKSISIF